MALCCWYSSRLCLLGRVINMLQRGLASYKRLQIILEHPGIPEAEMKDAKEPVGGDVEIKI